MARPKRKFDDIPKDYEGGVYNKNSTDYGMGSPEANLWFAIVMQALADIQNYNCTRTELRNYAATALSFINSDACKMICGIVGLSHDRIVEISVILKELYIDEPMRLNYAIVKYGYLANPMKYNKKEFEVLRKTIRQWVGRGNLISINGLEFKKKGSKGIAGTSRDYLKKLGLRISDQPDNKQFKERRENVRWMHDDDIWYRERSPIA